MIIEINIPAKKLQYPICIGEKFEEVLLPLLSDLKPSKIAILTDTHLESTYAFLLQEVLNRKGFSTLLITLPPGEKQKNRETKEMCEDKLLENSFGRDSCLVSMGGGVITDLGGFIASTYARGIPSILIPTSLLAMVDAAIGGKTGIDVPQGKNLIGTIYHPKAIIIDTAFLNTLPIDEVKHGCAEMLKHGIIGSEKYFLFLGMNADKILGKDTTLLKEAIKGSFEIKSAIVMEDPNEKGKRRLLNFGHTIGHALETISNYEISHGRAVAIGTVVESYLSYRAGYLNLQDFNIIQEVINEFQIDLSLTEEIKINELIKILKNDKKARFNNPRFVLIEKIGKPLAFDGEYCSTVSEDILKESLEWMISLT